MRCILGIDTSNYTTSVCAISAETGDMVAEARQLLPVTKGDRGLRQSDALFFHVSGLPLVMRRLMDNIHQLGVHDVTWTAIGVSVRPRPFARSYMPVFMAGQSFAHSFAQALSIPVVHFSHQEGHIAAAEHFLKGKIPEKFVAVHISGGTSDVMVARRTKFGYFINLVGEGSDLHVGQFVDRVGVSLGLPFPAGPALERLALESTNQNDLRFSASVKGSSMSFSGPCSAALRAIESGKENSAVARAVEACVANSVVKSVSHVFQECPDLVCAVIAGGVASNQWIRNRILHRLKVLYPGNDVHFAPVAYSSDNSLGIAALTYRFMMVQCE